MSDRPRFRGIRDFLYRRKSTSFDSIDFQGCHVQPSHARGSRHTLTMHALLFAWSAWNRHTPSIFNRFLALAVMRENVILSSRNLISYRVDKFYFAVASGWSWGLLHQPWIDFAGDSRGSVPLPRCTHPRMQTPKKESLLLLPFAHSPYSLNRNCQVPLVESSRVAKKLFASIRNS